ncbi:MAG: ATP synthase subunit I [Candidatus Cloacimonetes bacterium]|nr:ATP synthase subunit I [Candidatus Cloacimonadota bacterium]
MIETSNKLFVRKTLTLILLTEIPAILTLPLFLGVSLGWILGALASAVNFYWLAKNVESSISQQPTKSKLNAIKGTYLRMAFLLIYSIIILTFVKPNVISFGLGLLAAQIVLYLRFLVENIEKSKFFRGRNG